MGLNWAIFDFLWFLYHCMTGINLCRKDGCMINTNYFPNKGNSDQLVPPRSVPDSNPNRPIIPELRRMDEEYAEMHRKRIPNKGKNRPLSIKENRFIEPPSRFVDPNPNRPIFPELLERAQKYAEMLRKRIPNKAIKNCL